jgi:hypothetical protein
MSQLLQNRRAFVVAALVASAPPMLGAYNMRAAPFFAIGLLVWGLLPIAIAFLIHRFQRWHAAWGWLTAILVFAYISLVQILQSKSSTASLDYLFIPLWSASIAGPIGAFIGTLLSRRLQPHAQPSPFMSTWRVASLTLLLVGALLSLFLLARFGGDTRVFSGMGFWVTTPYLLSCIALILSQTGIAQKITFAASLAIVAVGGLGYMDALFLNADDQSALVFGVLPVLQIAIAGACNVVALLIGSRSQGLATR